MERIKIMVNGVPGNMAAKVVSHAFADDRFEVIPFALTGPEIEETEFEIDGKTIRLIHPNNRKTLLDELKQKHFPFISVDYTHPSVVNDNAAFYIENNFPFVMGTTGGNRQKLVDDVVGSDIPAVISPNMGKQIVGFQAMMEYAANTFPDLFRGYTLEIQESHQKGKADTSGTAKAMVKYFNKLGLDFDEENIIMERDPEKQKTEWEIPEAYLSGHGWHTYTLSSDDGTVKFQFCHNVNGRDIYAKGTLDAVVFLNRKIARQIRGKVFTMIDVLKGD